MFTLPWADHLQEFVIFGAFDDGIDPGEFGMQQLVDVRCRVEQIERAMEITRDRLDALISFIFERFRGLLALFQTEIAAGQRGGDAEIGVAIHARDPVFHPARVW